MNVAARNASYCATLVDEWVHQGLTHAVVAPGSRSAPLALALERDHRVATQVVLDERGAAFMALGIGRATQRPALVLCTSGTAATHFHAAVVEANHSRVPLLVVTADRPPELHGIGAAQTIDQQHLYGSAVRWYGDPGPPEGDSVDRDVVAERWRSIAAQAYRETTGRTPGPVQLNLALREPLVGSDGAAIGTPGSCARPDPERLDAATVTDLARRAGAIARGVIVAGWGADVSAGALDALSRATGWPVLADAISNSRHGPHAVYAYEALVRVPALATALRPETVLRFGAALTSKVVTQWLADVPQHIVVNTHHVRIDPTRSATEWFDCDGDWFATALADARSAVAPPDTAWSTRWHSLDEQARSAIDKELDAAISPTGPRVARDAAAVTAASPGTHLVVASSMPVRDLEWCAGSLEGVVVHANRGANGIDGLIATSVGVALASRAPTVVLLGDLAFLHDAGSLLGIVERGVGLTIVVADNDGGGIFSFLAQHEHSPRPEFERLFGTPHGVDLVAIACAYGVDANRVHAPSAVRDAVTRSIASGGVHVIVVPVLDRDADIEFHRSLWSAAEAAVVAV